MDIYDIVVSYLLPRLDSLGLWGYWAVLFVALLESLAFVGILFPGSTIIVLIGFLSAQGFLDIGDLVWFTVFGAIIGDNISYYLGHRGKKLFPGEGRLLKKNHLEAAERFFARHGNKSVFLGRFIGPLRSIVPFVAGFSRMNYGIFLFWNASSALLWSVSHLYAGYFFGGVLAQSNLVPRWVSISGVILVVATVSFFIMRWQYREVSVEASSSDNPHTT